MTRLFTEGFEMGDGLFFNQIAGAINSSNQRSGTYAWNVTDVLASGSKKAFTPASEFYFRMAFRADDVNTSGVNFLLFYGSGTNSLLGFGFSAGKIVASIGGTGTISLQPNVWYLLEVYYKIADASGRVVTKIDGVTDIDYTGDTKPGSDTQAESFIVGRPYPSGGTTIIDDLALNNTAGGADDSWCGDGRIVALTPNGNGTTNQWTGSDGNSTDNYLLVDERPSNNDTDYSENSTTGQRDMYTMTDWDESGSKSILRVWGECRAKDTVAEGGQIKVGLRTESTVYLSAAKSLLTSYTQIKGDEYKTNPNTATAWTNTQADAVEFVVETV